jgi:hypothetical protein
MERDEDFFLIFYRSPFFLAGIFQFAGVIFNDSKLEMFASANFYIWN